MGCCQGFEESTESRCQTIICFVSVCPYCITSSNWFCVDFQDGVVRWNFFKSDVGMPTVGCEFGTIVLVLIVLVTEKRLAEITRGDNTIEKYRLLRSLRRFRRYREKDERGVWKLLVCLRAHRVLCRVPFGRQCRDLGHGK